VQKGRSAAEELAAHSLGMIEELTQAESKLKSELEASSHLTAELREDNSRLRLDFESEIDNASQNLQGMQTVIGVDSPGSLKHYAVRLSLENLALRKAITMEGSRQDMIRVGESHLDGGLPDVASRKAIGVIMMFNSIWMRRAERKLVAMVHDWHGNTKIHDKYRLEFYCGGIRRALREKDPTAFIEHGIEGVEAQGRMYGTVRQRHSIYSAHVWLSTRRFICLKASNSIARWHAKAEQERFYLGVHALGLRAGCLLFCNHLIHRQHRSIQTRLYRWHEAMALTRFSRILWQLSSTRAADLVLRHVRRSCLERVVGAMLHRWSLMTVKENTACAVEEAVQKVKDDTWLNKLHEMRAAMWRDQRRVACGVVCAIGGRWFRSVVKERLRLWHEEAMIARLSPSHVLREMELERAQIMFNFKWKKQYIAVRLIQRRVARAWIQDMRIRISLWVLNRSRTRCPFAAATCQRVYKERSSIAKEHEQLRLKHWNIHGLY